MGKRTEEELNRKTLFRDLTEHIYKEARVNYAEQANAIKMSGARMASLRSEKDTRYIPSEVELEDLRLAFPGPAASFGTPSELDQELAKLREDLARLESLLADKSGDVEELLREKGKLQEENKRLIEKYAAFLEKLVDPDKVREIIEGATRLNDGEK